ncbi:MAG: NAD(P)H-dependent oxidoreductase [Cetobacterium sp.]|nr:NAD(P)H-dependent oxidoreductase [Cetobacterium sp.]
MKKILCIIATPKKEEESYGRQMTHHFIKEYLKLNINDKIDILNLYDKEISFLDCENIIDCSKSQGKMYEYANKFKLYDKYIICSPMWNLSIPGILKAYLDLIIANKITFKYNSLGIPKGLLANKNVFYIGTRGGAYPFPISFLAYDLKYIKCIFKFIGIKDFKNFVLENIDKKPEYTKKEFPKTLLKISNFAKKF